MDSNQEQLQIRVCGDATLPTLVYLPGLHGDWTLIASFRAALAGRVRFVEITYPRTLTWTIEDYAQAIEAALWKAGITHGWLLGESFGSQLAWPILQHNLDSAEPPFQVDGLILAAGFARHPWKHGPAVFRRLGGAIPTSLYRSMLKVYAAYAKFRHRDAPETLANISEFVARRTELDRQAMRHRLALLDGYDPNPIARQTRVPVFYLAGAVDPLVPWPLVRRWLQKNCPGFRGSKTFWRADHNVLATAPARSAEVAIGWISSEPGGST
jgi:pimeloyl-ACP methyl ester carboxylesterase